MADDGANGVLAGIIIIVAAALILFYLIGQGGTGHGWVNPPVPMIEISSIDFLDKTGELEPISVDVTGRGVTLTGVITVHNGGTDMAKNCRISVKTGDSALYDTWQSSSFPLEKGEVKEISITTVTLKGGKDYHVQVCARCDNVGQPACTDRGVHVLPQLTVIPL